ncbi:MAG: PEGA domain-containing protein [Deltaproteobacteria bacterium]|nr:PEGA domain-containing protein [Deltaproteobacteria bacterium]
MRLHWLVPGLIALALGGFHPRSAFAQSEISATAVLGLEGFDVPTTLTDEMSEQLRQRVASTRDMRLVSGKDLIEVKLVFSCADEAATCMTQAGKSLDAHKLIYGSVKRSGDDYAVWLKMFDVRRAKIESGLTETLPRKSADPAGIKAASARWFAKLTGRPVNIGSTVQVTSNVSGATVLWDGIALGTTADLPLTIADVAPGKHALVVSKAGHVTAKSQVVVAAGQAVPVVNVTLQPSPEQAVKAVAKPVTKNAPATQAKDSDVQAPAPGDIQNEHAGGGRGGYRAGFWVTFIAGLASAGAAVKFGLDVADVNKRLDPYRRFSCMGNQLCDAKGTVRPALTTAEKNSVSTLNDEGSRDQTLQWICVGVGSALGIASGYLLYKGYIDSDGEHPQNQARHGLRIFPTAGASSSGIVAEFDF